MKPVLFVTGHVPRRSRVGAFERLHERVGDRARALRRPPPPWRSGRPRRRRRFPHRTASTSARSARWSPQAPTAPSSSAPAGASRCRPPGGAARARRAVPLLGGAVAHAADRRAPRGAAADAQHLPRRRCRRHLRRARQRVRARATGRDARVRRAPGGRQRVLVGARRAAQRRRFAALFVGRAGAREGPCGRAGRLAQRAALEGDLHGRRRQRSAEPAPGVARPRAARSAGTAQLLRMPRRSGYTVHRHAPVHRAVGAGGQRSHEPGSSDHRQRRRRRSRRRTRARRAQRPRRSRPATPPRWPAALDASPPTASAARRWAQPGARTSPASPSTRGPTASCRRSARPHRSHRVLVAWRR